MGYLRRVHSATLCNKMRSYKNRKALNLQSLHLRIEKVQLGWFGFVFRMFQEKLARQVPMAKPTRKRSKVETLFLVDDSTLFPTFLHSGPVMCPRQD